MRKRKSSRMKKIGKGKLGKTIKTLYKKGSKLYVKIGKNYVQVKKK